MAVTITFATPHTFTTENTSETAVVALSATKAIVAWNTSNVLKARVVNISGTTLSTPGAIATVASTNASTMHLHRIDDTRALVAYSVSAFPNIKVRVLSLAGDDVSMGTEVSLGNGSTHDAALVLSATQGVSFFREFSSNLPRAVAYTIAGSAITAGSPTTVDGTNTAGGLRNMHRVSNTLACAGWNRADLTNRGSILTASGTTVTVGTVASTPRIISYGSAAFSDTAGATFLRAPTLSASTLTYTATTVTMGSDLGAVSPPNRLAAWRDTTPSFGIGAFTDDGGHSYFDPSNIGDPAVLAFLPTTTLRVGATFNFIDRTHFIQSWKSTTTASKVVIGIIAGLPAEEVAAAWVLGRIGMGNVTTGWG